MNNNYPVCRYCKKKVIMELEKDEYEDEIGEVWYAYWYKCPMCGSGSPVSGTSEGALEYAVNGYA